MEWISVNDAVPNDKRWVLAWHVYVSHKLWHGMRINRYNKTHWEAPPGDNVSHWMDLPEPPK